MYVHRLLTDHFYITEDCLNKLHEYPNKITFIKTICLSIFSGIIQALLAYRLYRWMGVWSKTGAMPSLYHIAQKFGGVRLRRIDHFRVLTRKMANLQ